MRNSQNKVQYYISNTQDGNLSLSIWSDETKVLENRKKLAWKLSYSVDKLVTLNQVHGNEVVLISHDNYKEKLDWDAIITKEKWIVIWVLTADCIPIILYDEISWIVCTIHAGWKWTNLKIVEKSLEKMLNLWANILNIKAIIWPGIWVNSYEVWKEVWDYFRTQVKKNLENWKVLLNLKEENKLQLLEKWVLEENISILEADTFTNKTYFSARRDGFHKWRFGSFIWLGEG
jgi:YfiH family protein